MAKEKVITLICAYQMRIDKYLAKNTDFSRSEIQKLISNHNVEVNKKIVHKPNFILKVDSEVVIVKPIINLKIEAQKIDLEVVYNDEHLAIINKPSGIVTHPAPGNYNNTLVNGLMYYFKNSLSNLNGIERLGIVHRLDKDTSGLIIIAKTNQAHQILSEMIKERKVTRKYLALIEGKLDYDIIHLNLPIGRSSVDRKKMAVTSKNSKSALTHVYVKKVFANKSLVECKLETGRTHQIRVHLAHINHPVIGDPLYGQKIDQYGQRLHAHTLEFLHPITQEKLFFKAGLPKHKFD